MRNVICQQSSYIWAPLAFSIVCPACVGEARSGQAAADVAGLHQGEGENSAVQESREALASDWLGLHLSGCVAEDIQLCCDTLSLVKTEQCD